MLEILLVEDEPWIRKALRKMIEPLPEYVVIGESGNGLHALELLQQCRPDVILTDIKMPGLNGLDLAAQARKHLPRVEIILFSGYNEFEYVREAMRQGAHDYLLKPIQRQELEHVLQRLAEKLRLRKQDFPKRQAWMETWHRSAKQMAASLWRMEKAETERIWTALTDEWLHYARQVDVYDFYQQLVYTLNEELHVQFGGKLPDLIYHPPDFTGDAAADAALIMERLLAVQDDWQARRKWSRNYAVNKALAYIQQNYMLTGLSLQSAAEFAGVSPSYLSRSFKEEIGRTFVESVTDVRMEQARLLLASPDNRIYEVAECVGYPVYAYFARVFKRQYGQSPTAYRATLGIHEQDDQGPERKGAE